MSDLQNKQPKARHTHHAKNEEANASVHTESGHAENTHTKARLANMSASAKDVVKRAGVAAGVVASETAHQVHEADAMLNDEKHSAKTKKERMQHALGVYDPSVRPNLYTYKTGDSANGYANVYNLSARKLYRKQKITGLMILPVALCALVAALIAWGVYGWADTNILNSNEQATRKVNEQLQTIQEVNLPTPATFINKDDESIAANLEATDTQIYRATSSDASVTLVMYRIPSTLNVAVGQTQITQGINSLSPADATRLLNGLWNFEVTRANGTCAMRFKYADFTSGDVASAVTHAMLMQGLGEDTVTDAGVDDSGNTYKTGEISINDAQVSWRISAIPLTDMYSVKGLPSNSVFVGIRYSY